MPQDQVSVVNCPAAPIFYGIENLINIYKTSQLPVPNFLVSDEELISKSALIPILLSLEEYLVHEQPHKDAYVPRRQYTRVPDTQRAKQRQPDHHDDQHREVDRHDIENTFDTSTSDCVYDGRVPVPNTMINQVHMMTESLHIESRGHTDAAEAGHAAQSLGPSTSASAQSSDGVPGTASGGNISNKDAGPHPPTLRVRDDFNHHGPSQKSDSMHTRSKSSYVSMSKNFVKAPVNVEVIDLTTTHQGDSKNSSKTVSHIHNKPPVVDQKKPNVGKAIEAKNKVDLNNTQTHNNPPAPNSNQSHNKFKSANPRQAKNMEPRPPVSQTSRKAAPRINQDTLKPQVVEAQPQVWEGLDSPKIASFKDIMKEEERSKNQRPAVKKPKANIESHDHDFWNTAVKHSNRPNS
ncbi:hypothetical protein RF11_13824 [Thelohanellus kitauei]|uniref:Uncharacterized protein n=1 Tax=Thelohanellus kitauei TaxID=669202 RepID=A0A0C2IAQ0_THEKT|nr:hypothetical protein RF11_13824 [Thelohanellus kitauei]